VWDGGDDEVEKVPVMHRPHGARTSRARSTSTNARLPYVSVRRLLTSLKSSFSPSAHLDLLGI
jgi:hypothetical protein